MSHSITIKLEGLFFPVWKTIKNNFESYLAVLNSIMLIEIWVRDRLPKISFPEVGTEVDLVLVPVYQLGFTETTLYSVVCARAVEFGFELCPPWLAFALREQYTEQWCEDEVVIGMSPITDEEGNTDIFYLGRTETNGMFVDNAKCDALDGQEIQCLPSMPMVLVRPRD